MRSAASPPHDTGLLSPVRAGTEVESLTTDEAWLQAMLDVELALLRAQSRLGAVPPQAARTIADAARAERFDVSELAVAARAAANPVVGMVERLAAAVAEVDRSAADYVHRGSTSQDVLDTAGVLVARRALTVIIADLDRVSRAAAVLAERHRGTPMPGRTLTQHAVPITFGLKAAGWMHGVDRAAGGLRRVAAGLPIQLGGAAGTLAGYLAYAGDDVDTASYTDRLLAAVAAELGLAEPVLPWHTERGVVAELAWSLATATGALGKIAVDVRSLARSEIAEVAEPAAPGRGASSAMPQKRNPVMSALIIAASMQIGPLAGGLMQTMLSEDERSAGAWQAEWQPLRECLRLAGGAARTAAELVEGLEVDTAAMRRNLDLTDGLIVAERVAAVLTPLLGKSEAKRLVTRASLVSVAERRSLMSELAAMPDVAGRLDDGALRDLFDPEQYLGSAQHLVDRALHAHRAVVTP